MVDLTPKQAEAITSWAAEIPQVMEMRLFGSRAKGCATAHSDVDLAVAANAETYFALVSDWEPRLSKLGLNVQIPDFARNPVIQPACKECSLVLS